MMKNPKVFNFVRRKDLIWSLEPLFLLMKAIGFNLKGQEIPKSSSFVKRCAFYLYSLAWFTLSCSCFIATSYGFFNAIKKHVNSNLKRNPTLTLSRSIDKTIHSGKV